MRGAQSALRLLNLAAQLLDRALVLGHVLAVLLVEDLDEVRHHTLVKVLTAQVGVAVRGHDLEDAVVDGQQRDIEGAATQVVNQNVLLGLLVQAVGDGSRRRLVNDPQNIHTRDDTGILRGLTLSIVEVRRHRDHGVLHLLAEVVLGGLLHLGQDHGGHLLRRHDLGLALDLHPDHGLGVLIHDLKGKELHVLLDRGVLEAAANEALHVEERLRRVDGGLILGRLTDQTLIVREGHVGGRDAVSLVVRDDLDTAILVDADARVGRTQIDTDHRTVDLLLVVLGESRRSGQGQQAESDGLSQHGQRMWLRQAAESK
mmetsp:Transcript_15799/g.47414  ORF Transcript_15799/g.47414 Transcript_15799/m.47414 type:complete len:315 (-) Transcript_15799:19-963(-)